MLVNDLITIITPNKLLLVTTSCVFDSSHTTSQQSQHRHRSCFYILFLQGTTDIDSSVIHVPYIGLNRLSAYSYFQAVFEFQTIGFNQFILLKSLSDWFICKSINVFASDPETGHIYSVWQCYFKKKSFIDQVFKKIPDIEGIARHSMCTFKEITSSSNLAKYREKKPTQSV